jgi:predicted RNA-binding protein with PUA-like domain
MAVQYWLMKTEPSTYSIDDLKREKVTHWEGIRNYQARNFMRDQMKIGDLVLVYHSNANPPGVAGIGEVCSSPYADFFSWDIQSEYFDPKSTPQKPRWVMVDIKFVAKFSYYVTLNEIKQNIALQEMMVIKKGMRLSIQPVNELDFKEIVKRGG